MNVSGFCVFRDTPEYRKYATKCFDSMLKTQDYQFEFYVYTNTPKWIEENYPKFKIKPLKEVTKLKKYKDITNLISNKLVAFDELTKISDIVFCIDLDTEFKKSLKDLFPKLKKNSVYGSLELDNYNNFTLSKRNFCNVFKVHYLKYINAGFLIFTFKFNFDVVDYNKFLKNRFVTCCEQEYLSYKFKDQIKIINVSHNPCLKENKDYYIFHYLGNFKC